MNFFKLFLWSFVLCTNLFSASFTALKDKGNAFFQEKNYDLALENYEASFDLASSAQEFATAHANTAQCYRLKSRNYLALLHFQKALQYDPTHKKALYWSEELLLKRQRDFEYFPNFLTADEANIFADIFTRANWREDKLTYSTAVDLNIVDRISIELLLSLITDRMREKNLLPEGIEEWGVSFLRYPPRGSINPHKDDQNRVGDFVFSMSVGGSCSLDLIHDKSKIKHSNKIEGRSAYVMKGKAHTDFMHGISDVKNVRFSILLYKTLPCKNRMVDEIKYNLKERKLEQHMGEFTKAMLDISRIPGISNVDIEYF